MPRSKFGCPVKVGRRPKGILVVIEGMDGVGKSTVTAALAEMLSENGIPVHCTREPTRGPFGTMLRERQSLGIRYTPWEEYWLFMLDRVAHGQEIRQHLAQGTIVISDRYWHSTWVYQIPRMLEDQSAIQSQRDILVKEAIAITPLPDLLCILDLSVAEAQKRILRSRGSLDAFETETLLVQYRASYQQLAEEMGGLFLSADCPIPSLVAELHKRVMHLHDSSIPTL